MSDKPEIRELRLRGNTLEEFHLSNTYAINLLKHRMSKDGITISDAEATEYMAWCYEVVWQTLLGAIPEPQRPKVSEIAAAASHWCGSQFCYAKTGTWPPPKGPVWPPPNENVSQETPGVQMMNDAIKNHQANHGYL